MAQGNRVKAEFLPFIRGRPKAVSKNAPRGSQGASPVARFHCVRLADRCLAPDAPLSTLTPLSARSQWNPGLPFARAGYGLKAELWLLKQALKADPDRLQFL